MHIMQVIHNAAKVMWLYHPDALAGCNPSSMQNAPALMMKSVQCKDNCYSHQKRDKFLRPWVARRKGEEEGGGGGGGGGAVRQGSWSRPWVSAPNSEGP